MNLEYFGNDKYAILSFMYDKQIDYNGDRIVQVGMQTIADELHFRKMKVVALVGELIFDGFIIRYSPKGKYQITDKGLKVILMMKSEV